MNVNVNPDVEKSTRGQLEKKVIASRESISRLRSIVKDFKPEFITLGDKIGAKFLRWGEKAGVDLSPEQSKALGERATFFQKTYDSVNRAIRDMTGAQMSESEADRLMKGMPNQDDAPTEFMAKLNAVIEQVESYDRQYSMVLGQGLPLETPGGDLDSKSDDELDAILAALQGGM